MTIAISARLTDPPGSISCFRDVTLYAKCFLDSEVLLECPSSLQDLYWKLLKKRGASDELINDITSFFDENHEAPYRSHCWCPTLDLLTSATVSSILIYMFDMSLVFEFL